MAYNVQFTRCLQEKFDALETKDNNTIYFITDTPALYLGSVKYTSVTELAAALTRISASETSVTNLTNALSGISLSTKGSVKSAIDGVSTSLNTKTGSLTNLKTASKTDIVSAINEVYVAVDTGGTASVVTLTKEATANSGYLSTYTLYQGTKSIGQIDIPKDLVVTSGSVVKATADEPINGMTSGEFIKLVIQNQDDPIYINASSLVDVYTAKSGADKIQLSIVGGVISADVVAKSIGTSDLADSSITTVKLADENITDAKIARGTITKGALATAIQSSLTKADSAVQSVTAGTSNGTVKVNGTDLSVTGLKSAAYTESSAYDIAGAANAVKSTVTGASTDTATTLTLYGLKAKDASLESSINSLTNTVNNLNVTDSEKSGYYVSAVSQTNGKIAVTREALPDYSTVAANANTAMNTANIAASSASASATNAKTSASEAESSNQQAKKWASATESPDGAVDTDSPTGKTQSSRSWALESKANAESVSSSARTAATQAYSSSSSAASASASASNAKTSATSAESSNQQAKSWAIATDSPDGATDTGSSTGKTQSARSWALSAKASASDAKNYSDTLIPILFDGTVDTYNKVQRTWFLSNGAETADAATLTSLVDKWYTITRPDWDGYVEFYNPDVSSVTTGTKRGDLAGMVCEPSTTTVAGRDDFAGNPLFAVTTVNWVMNGTEPQITAIKGITSNYEQDNPAKYVGVVQMSGYHYWTDPTEQKTDTYMEGYCSKYKNKYSHIEPLPESIRVDKTIRPWVIHAKYLGGVDSDGKATCCSGQVIKDQVSHNNWHDTVKNNGPTYSGWCICDLSFLKLMTHIKFASLTLDNIMNGCFSYYLQDYVALAESDTNRVLIASTGNDYVVGSRIFIGANKQSDGIMEMTQNANTYSLSGRDGRIVTSVQTVTIDGTTYKAIYFTGSPITTYINDPSTGFTVAIHTAWWNTGSTDDVLGNTGSIDNKDQRYPIMLQGIEFACGQYEIPVDCIVKYWQDTTDTAKYYYAPYIVNTVANQSTDITSNYIDIGIHIQCPENNDESYIKYEKYKNGVYFPYLVGGSSSTYACDMVWRYGAGKYTGSVELMCFGRCDWDASAYGLSRLHLGNRLSITWWHRCSRLSPNGNRGAWGA